MLGVPASEFSHSVFGEEFLLLYVSPIGIYEEHNVWVLCLLIGCGGIFGASGSSVVWGRWGEGSWSVSADVLGLSTTCFWDRVFSGEVEGTLAGCSLLSFLTSSISF